VRFRIFNDGGLVQIATGVPSEDFWQGLFYYAYGRLGAHNRRFRIYADTLTADFIESKLPAFFTYDFVRVAAESNLIPFQFYVCPDFVDLFDKGNNASKMCFIPACYSYVKDIFPGLKEEQYQHPYASLITK
jgi:hypothetical protein